MPGYRVRYSMWVDFTDAQGLGMNSANVVGVFGPTLGPTLQINQSICPGSQTFTATDINNILAQVQTDLTTQLTANLTRIQNFASGGG